MYNNLNIYTYSGRGDASFLRMMGEVHIQDRNQSVNHWSNNSSLHEYWSMRKHGERSKVHTFWDSFMPQLEDCKNHWATILSCKNILGAISHKAWFVREEEKGPIMPSIVMKDIKDEQKNITELTWPKQGNIFTPWNHIFWYWMPWPNATTP